MPRKKKLNVTIDNIDSLQDLMQEVYHDACGQIVDAQNGINAMVNGSEPQDTDDHAKIAKAKADFLKLKDSAIKMKLDVGRLQNEVIKNKGAVSPEVAEAVKDNGDTSLDTFSKIRKMISAEKEKKKNEE
jgi:hypothetical protein